MCHQLRFKGILELESIDFFLQADVHFVSRWNVNDKIWSDCGVTTPPFRTYKDTVVFYQASGTKKKCQGVKEREGSAGFPAES